MTTIFSLIFLLSPVQAESILEKCERLDKKHQGAFWSYCYDQFSEDTERQIECAYDALTKEERRFYRRYNCAIRVGS